MHIAGRVWIIITIVSLHVQYEEQQQNVNMSINNINTHHNRNVDCFIIYFYMRLACLLELERVLRLAGGALLAFALRLRAFLG